MAIFLGLLAWTVLSFFVAVFLGHALQLCRDHEPSTGRGVDDRPPAGPDPAHCPASRRAACVGDEAEPALSGPGAAWLASVSRAD